MTRLIDSEAKSVLDQAMKKFALMIALSVFFLAFLHQATAATLTAVPEMPALTQTTAVTDCSKIKSDLKAFKENYLSNAKTIAAYSKVMSQVTGQWYSELFPLEEKTVTLPQGTFASLEPSAVHIEAAVQDFYSYVDHIDTEIGSFLESIESCKMSKPDQDQWTLAFQAFSEKNSESLGVSVEYVSSVANQIREWQAQWGAYEGASVLVPLGEFEVVLEASQGLIESASLIESNAQLTVDELNGISLEELENGRSSNDGTLQLYRR